MRKVNSDKNGNLIKNDSIESKDSGLYVGAIFKFLLSCIIVIFILIYGIKFFTVDIFQFFK